MITVMKLIDDTIAKEGNGRYTDDPSDSGGPTRWGITKKTARLYGYTGDMRELPRGKAVDIYMAMNWVEPGFSKVERFSPELAAEMFDYAAPTGAGTVIKMLQRCLNVLNLDGDYFPDIKVDGVIGEVTTMCLAAYTKRRGGEGVLVLRGMVKSLYGNYLIELAERRAKDEKFIYGWFKNRVLGL